MREILFRGKRVDNGEWVYGFLDKIPDPMGFNMSVSPWWIHVPPKDPDDAGCSYNVIRYGQFTGLTDKNGKKVFEGDVIKFHKYRYEPDWVGAVCYEYCSYVVKGRMPLAYEKRIGEDPYYCPFEVAMSGVDKTRIEIIGNIYDNPGLVDEDVIGGDGERRTDV